MLRSARLGKQRQRSRIARVDAGAQLPWLVETFRTRSPAKYRQLRVYQILPARRVARALDIPHCSVVLARGDATGPAWHAAEDYLMEDAGIRMDANPELRMSASETDRSVLGDSGKIAAIPFSIEALEVRAR